MRRSQRPQEATGGARAFKAVFVRAQRGGAQRGAQSLREALSLGGEYNKDRTKPRQTRYKRTTQNERKMDTETTGKA